MKMVNETTCTHIATALGQLVVLSDCVCPGHELRLECTVVGGANTVWGGSAFSGCSSANNKIVLLHSRFEHGLAVGKCNNGEIIGRGIRQVGLNYTSQLIVYLNVNSTLRGKTVECFHDDGLYNEVTVDNYTIIYPLLRGTALL